MTSIMHLMVDNYKEILDARKDPLVDSWLFMQSPAPVLTILAAYLYFVLKLGPKYMEKREAYHLKYTLIVYNAYQVGFSVWFCFTILKPESFAHIFQKSCTTQLPGNLKTEFSKGAWWYFFSKIIELLDTVFFVLRKKQSQVTFLHVYHHTITALFSWCYLKLLPGEQGIFLGFLNSFVHVVMYTYYFIAALGPQYQKYLWWKKYMTWIQLIQFCIMLVYLSYITAMDCNFPRPLTFFFIGNVLIFLYLFADFYIKAYKKPKKMMDNKNVSPTMMKMMKAA